MGLTGYGLKGRERGSEREAEDQAGGEVEGGEREAEDQAGGEQEGRRERG